MNTFYFEFYHFSGAGYLLSIVKQSSCPSDYVLKQVKHHIPNAFTRSDYGEEIRILLPLESIHKFGNLFEDLESNKISLGISSFGVSVTTMEEVFFQYVVLLVVYCYCFLVNPSHFVK